MMNRQADGRPTQRRPQHRQQQQQQQQQQAPTVYKCRKCERQFAASEYGGEAAKASRACNQHERYVHDLPANKLYCPVCAKQFDFAKYRGVKPAKQACAQHMLTAHMADGEEEEEEHMPDPPVSSPGMWVPYADFHGMKSFGYYVCSCRKFWVSAHARVDCRQACQSCEKWRLPKYMWRNDAPALRKAEDDTNLDGPHDKARCEACRKSATGDCRERVI